MSLSLNLGEQGYGLGLRMNVFMSGIHFQLLLLSLVTRPGNLVNSILQVQYTLAESGDFLARR